MGEVNRYHVTRTLASIISAMNMLGLKVNSEATSNAFEKISSIT
jgi:hypothetical protein